jgi:iron(III) transport system substrate-binding protein
MVPSDDNARFSRRTMLLYLGATGLALAGCGGTDEASGVSGEGNTTDWGMTDQEKAAWTQIEEAAQKEGKVVYYSVGGVPADKADLFQELFARDHPGIEIQYLSPGNNAAIISKVITEQQSGKVVGDVVETSMGNVVNIGPSLMQEFMPPAAKDPDAKWAFEPMGVFEGKPRFTSMMLQYLGLWYNTDEVPKDQAPKTYQDLTDPKYKDNIVWRQPWNTGGGNHSYRFIKKLYGQGWIEAMRKQNITFVEDQDAGLLGVARGEYVIGMGLTGRQGASLIDQGLPLAISWPTDLSVRVTNGLIIQNNAPHANAAKVLTNWMISPAGQEMWKQLGQFPVNTKVPPLADWQKGYDVAADKEENLANGKELQDLLAQAKADFQR